MSKSQLEILAKMREILELSDAEYEATIEESLSWESV
jgi:hypothetical protein